jgi:hypothetical protein
LTKSKSFGHWDLVKIRSGLPKFPKVVTLSAVIWAPLAGEEAMRRVVWLGLGVACGWLTVLSGSAEPPKASPAKSDTATGTEVIIDGMKSLTPPTWKAEKPANRLRSYQFKLPHGKGDKDDAELFVTPEQPGTLAQNLTQWKELFALPPDRAKSDVLKEGKLTLGKATLYTLDIQGTYHLKNIPIDQAVKEVKPDWRMIAVLWESKDTKLAAIRLVGPRKTIEAHKPKFDEWLQNFK